MGDARTEKGKDLGGGLDETGDRGTPVLIWVSVWVAVPFVDSGEGVQAILAVLALRAPGDRCRDGMFPEGSRPSPLATPACSPLLMLLPLFDL